MRIDYKEMQHKLPSSWTAPYDHAHPMMAEDTPLLPASHTSSLVSDLLRKANGYSDVMSGVGGGGLEQKIRELREQKEAVEVKVEVGVIKTEAKTDNQDGPIDFSVKRRSSFSGSLTDDSQGSSSSPGHVTDYSAMTPPTEDISANHNADGGINSHSPSHNSFDDSSRHPSFNGMHHQPPSTMPPLINGLGLFPGLASNMSNMMGNGSAINAFSQMAAAAALMDPRGKKNTRPFKAYPKEALSMPLGFFGLPGMTASSLQQATDSGMPGEELSNMYNQQLKLMREKHLLASKSSPPSSKLSPPSSKRNGSSPHHHYQHNSHNNNQHHQHNISNISNINHPQHHQHQPPSPHSNDHHRLSSPPSSSTNHAHSDPGSRSSSRDSGNGPSPSYHSPPGGPFLPPSSSSSPPHSSSPSFSYNSSNLPLVSSTSPSLPGFSNSRKRPRSLPDDQGNNGKKDSAYWERRRKNNDAAKRSRDARRAKEDEIAIRAALLEQENIKLRVEVGALKTETARLRCLLYNS